MLVLSTMKKLLMVTVSMSMLMAFSSFAGQWKEDNVGRWYDNGNGTYKQSEWLQNNGKWYYFGADGYLLHDVWIGNYYVGTDGAMLTETITPDGYRVGENGAWIPTEQAENLDHQYIDAYATFLRSYKIPKGTTPQFHLLYIDGDSIPELLICNDGSYHGATVDLYCYNSGTVQKFATFGEYGSISYVKGSSLFCDTYAGAGGAHEYFYTLQNNQCTPLIQFECGEPGDNHYLINSFPVSEADYNNQLAAWKAMYTPVSFAGYHNGYKLNEVNIKKMQDNIQNVMPKTDK